MAAISRFALERELASGTLVALDVPRWRLTRTIAAVTARDVPLTPPAERFLALLRTMPVPPRKARSKRSMSEDQPTD